ncbi:MAG: hypothetical protein A3B30_02210 [Candidatus Komeilibacteria bacterium RIFCSPLOWO2_01_FULL_52_15]|uniref:RecF/RecN/SMC N-terminal domain-containing protein n=1 Tax=Candidatus Komeilibacteria bacterium RIFCSPLOWO2_01_FULL_52_15 TaxID=1798551 RepID=A0A1G2BT54_9BACT|nr:MAG: hypothetical protein A3B30_02210 [Candidatus Komeilibacteria bacterium RIFCSPLOWO2_01_FULL_52_15]
MFLEKIEIQGFKSFAEAVALVFNRELTAIVGPNGSGKSNIADAIRWVLGEQSLKLLRGKKSDDVIFAGSATKQRLGFARVALHLNNRDHRADIDYDEVVIERSIDRSGESDYLINGAKVRLVDVQLLLAKAQVGQKSYSVIGQGMIDSLLTFSASERKDFFDEATGVKQFQLKKNQAIHKLDQTEENLKQAELVLTEIEPRLRTLTRQVRRLERKEDLEKQLSDAQNNYYSYLKGMVTQDLSAAKQKAISAEQALSVIAQEQKKIQTEIDTHGAGTARDEAYNSLQRKLFGAQEEYNALTKKKILLEGQTDIELLKRGEGEQVLLKQRKTELDVRANSLASRIAEIDQRIARMKRTIEASRATVAETKTKLSRIERALASGDADSRAAAIMKSAQDLHRDHETLLQRIERLTTLEDVEAFKQHFKPFADKLTTFLRSLGEPAHSREHSWESFTALNAEYAGFVQTLHEAELKCTADEHQRAMLDQQHVEVERERAELARTLGADGATRKETIANDIMTLTASLDRQTKVIEQLRTDIDQFHKREEGKKQELITQQKKLRTLQYDYGIKNNELTGLKVELAKLETRLEDLEREIAQEAPNFSQHEVTTLNEVQTKDTITTVKKQLAIIGGIDTETLTEYKEVKEKCEFLKQQTTDLRAAQKSLLELIKELDEHISKQFQASFKNINTHFTKYFKKLFSGGSSKLTLTMHTEADETEEEELEGEGAGDDEKKGSSQLPVRRFDYSVDIQATPPGKKLSSTAMLSGGEKALTSIALICSIIANNPPPFVVLDEVDAALDEANSIRFAEIISELVDKTQFITITHNRATMHQAKILYGVTMSESGVSRLLSVNFEQADKLSA